MSWDRRIGLVEIAIDLRITGVRREGRAVGEVVGVFGPNDGTRPVSPVSTTYRAALTREIVCPLICKLMGNRDNSYGSIGPGAPAALDLG